MSSYRIVEHKVPCQHLREYPGALAHDEEGVLHLAVKQYIPFENPSPQPGDVTVLAAHANGFPKELYEPLWEDLIKESKRHGFRIRGIWMTDIAHQGQSGVLNEELVGNDPAWFDHSRDLLHLVNTKRDEMPRPIIGIGHSMGGAQLVNLAYFHPTLFTSLILMDPVIQPHTAEIIPVDNQTQTNTTKPLGSPSVAQLSTFRRDTWPSRQFARESLLKSPFYQTWDPRVLDRWIQYGLRDLPTPSHPDQTSPHVTLTTTITQEVRTFLRPNYEGYGANGTPINRKTHADVNPDSPNVSPFYRYEGPAAFARLPELRPSVFYVFATLSTTSNAEWNEMKVNRAGVGAGGSGGAKDGRVSSVTLEDVGHLIPMEAVGLTAEHVAKWVGDEMQRWRTDRAERERTWVKGMSLREKQTLDERWKKEIGGPLNRKKESKM